MMLTEAEWALRQQQTGKSAALMKAMEAGIAEYGNEALLKWQYFNGLREKPRFRVKAISQRGNE